MSGASGRDLAPWAEQWLRTEGAVTLSPEVTLAPDGTIDSVTVVQDVARTHVIRIGLYDGDGTGLRFRTAVTAEISAERTDVPVLAGQDPPAALVLNHGDLSYARISFSDQTFRALAAAAMDVGDPLTEAVCWNAAWHMVTSGTLAAADLAGLIIRRLPALPQAGLEVLLGRALDCADRYAPPARRAAIKAQLADAALARAHDAAPGGQRQRTLAAAFASSAHSDLQLELLRSWLAGRTLPAGLDLSASLRGQVLFTLSARGLATDDDLDTLARLDPVEGTLNRATGRAMRPDHAAKETAWRLALDPGQDWRTAHAHARGVWVPGQDAIMTGYLDRYFTQALPALAGREPRVTRVLARLLYPATLIAPATIAAADAASSLALDRALLTVVLEENAIMRAALAARGHARGHRRVPARREGPISC